MTVGTSSEVQTDLFTTDHIKLEVPFRSNQKEQVIIDVAKNRKRRRIEVFLAQRCDQFRYKLNDAKSFAGHIGRLSSKLASAAVLHEDQPKIRKTFELEVSSTTRYPWHCKVNGEKSLEKATGI